MIKARPWHLATVRLFAALRLLLLVAVIWQGFLTQTHSHAPPHKNPSSKVVAATGGYADANRGHNDAPADCPICRESASAGTYLASASIDLVSRPVDSYHYRPLLPVASSLDERRHSWRSRAPPVLSILPTA